MLTVARRTGGGIDMANDHSSAASPGRRSLLLVTLAALTVAVVLIVLGAVLGVDWSLMSHRPA
jgi:hypothetical protein